MEINLTAHTRWQAAIDRYNAQGDCEEELPPPNNPEVDPVQQMNLEFDPADLAEAIAIQAQIQQVLPYWENGVLVVVWDDPGSPGIENSEPL